MLDYIKQEANMTLTENGAATYASTGSECLDLFATIGALRRQSEDDIIVRFVRAYAEDPDTAMKLLFYARDVRGGLGERRVFRVILNWLAANEPASVKKMWNMWRNSAATTIFLRSWTPPAKKRCSRS